MGKIATWTEVNSIRNGAFYSSSTKCVTKSEVESIEFLKAVDRTSSQNVSMRKGTYRYGGHIAISSNNASASGDCSIYGTTNKVLLAQNNQSLYMYSGNANVEFEYDITENVNPGIASDCIENAVCISNVTLNPQTSYKWTSRLKVSVVYKTSQFSSVQGTTLSPYNVSGRFIVCIIDTTTNEMLTTPQTYNAVSYESIAIDISFTTSSGSTALVVVPLLYSCSATQTLINGGGSYFFGLLMEFESGVLTTYQSYYDTGNKCVQLEDIKHPTNKTFTMYYGIWNNKSGTQAKLDYVSVQIKKTTESTWTEIGVKTIGNVEKNGTLTGTVTCTLPTSYDPSVLYNLQVFCGDTNSSQSWQAVWGNSANIKTLTGWSSATSGVKLSLANSSYLNGSSSTSTLYNYNYPTTGSHRGRSSTYAACFKIS